MRVEKIGSATLYLADCLDVIGELDGVGAVVTDPPYGISANSQTLGTGKKQFHRGSGWDDSTPDILPWLSIAKHACFWGGNYFADQLPVTNHWLIWHKVNDGKSFSECEMAWTNFGRQVRHLSHHWAGEEKEHPTQKPLRVMQWTLANMPSGVNNVLDPFMGSGTTGVACVKAGLQFVGIERDPVFFDVACERIERAVAQEDLFNSSNGTCLRIEQPCLFSGD